MVCKSPGLSGRFCQKHPGLLCLSRTVHKPFYMVKHTVKRNDPLNIWFNKAKKKQSTDLSRPFNHLYVDEIVNHTHPIDGIELGPTATQVDSDLI